MSQSANGNGAAIDGGEHELQSLSIDAFLATLAKRDIRISLDGEKLKLSAPVGAVDAVLKAELTRRKPELATALREAGRPPALRKVSRTGSLPVSFAQQRLWFLDQMQPGASHYNIVFGLRFSGRMDEEALRWTLDEIVRRHEPLHTSIVDSGAGPVARLMSELDTVLDVVDVSNVDPAERAAEALRVAHAHTERPFDLAHGPMAAFLLIRFSDDERWLIVSMHHIASDGWSLSVSAREICALYEGRVSGTGSSLPALDIQYIDYAAWQQSLVRSGVFARQLQYWRDELAGAPALLELPTDRLRPAVQSSRGSRLRFRLEPRLLDDIKSFSLKQGATLYMTLLAVWQVLLHRHSGQEDIVVGSPLANRDRPELEGLIGCFVNNVAMRGRLGGNPTLREHLARVRSTVLHAFDNRELPFDQVVDGVRPERSTSHAPIFQVMFALQSFPNEARQIAGLHAELVHEVADQHQWARFDITLDADEHEGALRMGYEYATDLFDAATIERLHTQYVTLLRETIANPDRRVDDVPLMTPGEQHELLSRLNATVQSHDRSRSVHEIVLATAAERPDAIAVVAGGEQLTYAELVRRANALAKVLRIEGVVAGSTVGVCLDRAASLPVAWLAVLMTGAAYVPVDPAHPSERIAHTLGDAAVACVVSAPGLMAWDVGVAVVLVDDARLAEQSTDIVVTPVDASALAYVIYTSGSTGRPKGVEVEHRNVVNFLHAMQSEPGIGADDVLLAVTTPSFDIAGLEIWLPLVTGARVVIALRGDVLDGEALRSMIEQHRVSMLQATPTTWRLLIDSGWEGTPRLTALCGGERMPRELARDLVPGVSALWNMYGPTETTIWSTVHRVTESDREISIGHPIANTTIYIVDAAGRQVPIGVAGELCIGGQGVARGYRDRAALTAEKFVSVELSVNGVERVYRTGDVVRLLGDLTLEYVGRRDFQVKVRGHRIELGEIEAVLAEHASVQRNAVIVREDSPGDQRIVAYVVPVHPQAGATESMLALLRTRLPEYMVPSSIVVLDALPLTPNGKIDRKALPVPAASARSEGDGGIEPMMTDTQRRVAAVWREVLKIDRVGLHENFFDLGGHSLLVVKVHAALRREFGKELTVLDLFQRSTVAGQAELLADTSSTDVGLRRAQARAARHTA
ncbi:MAG TPA: amino acid adenylation domain-containing protein [Gemmatimonadaceae bacterium]